MSAAAVLALLALIPAVLWDPSAEADTVKRTIALAAAVLLAPQAIRAARAPRHGLTLSTAGLAYLGFTIFAALSLTWGRVGGTATLGTWVAGAMFLWATASLPEVGARRAAGLFGAALGSASSLVACGQLVLGERGMGLHGGHGNPNWLGLSVATCMWLTGDLTLVRRSEGAKRWWLLALLLPIQGAGLVLSESRVAEVAIAMGALFAAIAATRGKPRWRAAILGAAAVTGGALVWVSSSVAGTGGGPPGGPLASSWSAAVQSFAGRRWIWGVTWDVVKDTAPWGAGLGGFEHAFSRAQGARLSQLPLSEAARQFENATTAHNDLLETTATLGLVGGALFVAMALLAARAFATAGRAALLGATMTWLICALGDSPLQKPACVLPLVLLLGACPDRRSIEARWRAAIPALGLAASAALLALSARSWIAMWKTTEARGALPADRARLAAAAVHIDPWSGDARFLLGVAEMERGNAAIAAGCFARSEALAPSTSAKVALGNALWISGDREGAIAAYKQALSAHPASVRAHANLASVLLEQGRIDEAEAHLRAARQLLPNHPQVASLAERIRRANVERESSN